MNLQVDESGRFPAYAWPGGYPLYYLFADGGACCPACANNGNGSLADINNSDPQWMLVECFENFEDPEMWCDHCGALIGCAYGGN